jgi:anhydro-N-acetylmuramic acid kinase
MSYYIGQMSGTSLDGVDTVLMRFTDNKITLIAQHHLEFGLDLKNNILKLCNGCEGELHLSYTLANELSELYASSVSSLLLSQNITHEHVTAIGCHGQTVRHHPPEYTAQLINAALLAERCNIDVVCDFRSRDLAAGGQGAPLVPAFHQALFHQDEVTSDTFVVNLGGMANVSQLAVQGDVAGHDTGPGNVLMDAWCQLHQHKPYDENGQWAATGQVNPVLLEHLLKEEYFHLPPPKSTGRELFDLAWLQSKLATSLVSTIPTQDIMSTLTQLTANSIATEIEKLSHSGRVIVCGGGALNHTLMARLKERLKGFEVLSSSKLGHDPQCIEAMAFAWLAKRCIERKSANVPRVTGAKGGRILGAIYPA